MKSMTEIRILSTVPEETNDTDSVLQFMRNTEILSEQTCFRRAHAAGWWNRVRSIPELLFLIIGEITELGEAFRKNIAFEPCDKPISLTYVEEEVADIYIRLADFYGALRQENPELKPLNQIVDMKSEYNKTRGQRHGGKAF